MWTPSATTVALNERIAGAIASKFYHWDPLQPLISGQATARQLARSQYRQYGKAWQAGLDRGAWQDWEDAHGPAATSTTVEVNEDRPDRHR